MKNPCVYIMSNRCRGTLYIGVTSNLEHRIGQHKAGEGGAFTQQYRLTKLVLVESFADMSTAIAREKQLKRWHRDWKINLIEASNPQWQDLSQSWFAPSDPA